MDKRVLAGFVPLVDCAVLVAALEKGFAREHGIELVLVREPSWSSLRDHLVLGHVDCAHALAPLPIASTLGVGHVEAEMLVPFVLSRGGNAITLSSALAREIERLLGAVPAAPAAWGRGLASIVESRSKPLTLGMVHPFSGHNFELRYWLGAAGIHPDQHVRIVAIPPPLMTESLAVGHVDGFCVGEPWSSLAVERGIGRIVATKAQLFPRGVEKVLAVRPTLAAEGAVLRALVAALAAAAAWVDAPSNHEEVAALLARPAYVDVPPAIIMRSLGGRLELGGGARLAEPDFLYFHRYSANYPAVDEALWIYAQMLRWGNSRRGCTSARVPRQCFDRSFPGTLRRSATRPWARPELTTTSHRPRATSMRTCGSSVYIRRSSTRVRSSERETCTTMRPRRAQRVRSWCTRRVGVACTGRVTRRKKIVESAA
jgi:ABC-type nitrate/sulfonate/bicarbonate transport system substrate-binding protein